MAGPDPAPRTIKVEGRTARSRRRAGTSMRTILARAAIFVTTGLNAPGLVGIYHAGKDARAYSLSAADKSPLQIVTDVLWLLFSAAWLGTSWIEIVRQFFATPQWGSDHDDFRPLVKCSPLAKHAFILVGGLWLYGLGKMGVLLDGCAQGVVQGFGASLSRGVWEIMKAAWEVLNEGFILWTSGRFCFWIAEWSFPSTQQEHGCDVNSQPTGTDAKKVIDRLHR